MHSRLSIFLPLFWVAAAAAADPAAESFVRAHETPEKLSAAQTRTVEYQPANGTGPTITLVGAAHLGTAEYYAALQKRLDAATVVLFEGIGLGEAVKQGPGAATHQAGLQKQLAEALGLKFQLDAIDYRRPHFINSDLAAEGVKEEVQERTAKNPDVSTDDAFKTMMDALQGTGSGAEMLQPILALLGGSDQSRETMRLLLIEVLGRAGEFLDLAKVSSTEMRDLFEVILTERNEIVLRDLRTQLARLQPGQNVAIFYGAAHLPELAQRITTDFKYTAGANHWDTAFTADPAKSGMQPLQVRMMLDMVSQQLKAGGRGDIPFLAPPAAPRK